MGESIQQSTRTVAETEALAALIGALLQPGDLVALVGELGAGKTQFARGLAASLGVNPRSVASPTFVLLSEYEGGRVPVVHADAYRAAGPGELEAIGFLDLAEGAVAILEWADRVEVMLPKDRLEIQLEHGGEDGVRHLTVVPHGRWIEKTDELRAAMDMGPTGACPTCGGPVKLSVSSFPFCGTRCKMADLGKWFNGNFAISRPITEADEEV